MVQGQNPPSGDLSKSDHSHHSAGGTPSGLPPGFLPGSSPNDSFKESDNKKLQKLVKQQKQTEQKTKLYSLQEASKQGFQTIDEEPAAKRTGNYINQKIALERAKNVKRPDFYSSKSQQVLDLFLQDCNTVSISKPTIYADNTDKCLYAGLLLKETPRQDWNNKEAAIKADPSKDYN